jgi:hypothetical protein
MTESLARLSNATADEALKAAERGELAGFLQTDHAKWIKWTRSEGSSLVGNVPYLRAKSLSVYKFHLYPVDTQKDKGIRITSETPTIAYALWAVVFIFGCLMFCVGIILPILLITLVNNRIGQIREDIRQAFEAWDKTKSVSTPAAPNAPLV